MSREKLNCFISTDRGVRFVMNFKPDLVALLRRDVKGAFMTVERNPALDDVYVQAAWNSQDKYIVEFRDGSPERHFRKIMTSAEEVFAFFEQWLEGVPEGETWERVVFPARSVS